MTTLEQMNLSQPLTDVYTAMETDLMMAIAHQLAEGGEINATSEWRLKKLAEAGALSKETVRIIASYTGIQSDLITETIESAAMGVADRLEPALQACAKDGYISAADGTPISESVKNVVTNFRKQAKTDLNLVNTVMQYKAKTSYTTLVNKIYDDTKRQELLGVLGKHTLEVASGGTSRQEAVRNCIKEFSQKGIPAFVDKRGREWSPEAYINMDIRTTVNNTANAAQDACCDRYGLDLIQISSHMGARPKCAIDQGKLYSRSNHSGIAHDGDGNPIPFYPWSSTSYGQPDGILGINCHHHKYPFADGVNFQRYFPYDEEENAERYKEFQKQRAMERRVREVSRQADMLEAAGDTEGAKAARRQLREKRKAYREYSKEHGLAVHNDRLTVVKVRNGDMSYRNIYSSALDKSGESDIIKTRTGTVVNGQNVIGKWKRRPDFDNDIDDIIDFQGYNGKPTIMYNQDKFNAAVEKDHFLAERTFCADSQEQLDSFDNQLKAVNGEDYFYVNCSVGGAQYGQGMYCAADFTKGTLSYDKFEHEIEQYAWGDKHPFSKTNWLTLDPSAKILDIPSGSNRRECMEFIANKYSDLYLEHRLKNDASLKVKWDEYQKGMDTVRQLNGSRKVSDWDKAAELSEMLDEKYPEARQLQLDIMNCTDGKDSGVMAAEMGYDVINAQGHGTTESYSVVLNRTKLIIYGGDDYEYKQK